MNNIKDYRVEILTGKYNPDDLEQRKVINHLFGGNAKYLYEIYFHWYNIMHELGHAVVDFNHSSEIHPAQEEQLVNDFAFAYWQHYGETEKIRVLCDSLNCLLNNLTDPTNGNMSYIDYGTKVWGEDELYTPNNYGWFQFSCVKNAISNNKTLEQVLIDIGVSNIQLQEKSIFSYCVDENMPLKIIEDATAILSYWGVLLPEMIEIDMSDDPMNQMCRIIEL